jgi:hypothetical protein
MNITIIWFMARCHNCDLEMPFSNPLERDEWVEAHGRACLKPIDTWKEWQT